MSLNNWLTYIKLSLTNTYFEGKPKIGAHAQGVWRYKTRWGEWEPMGGQGGNSFLVKNPSGKLRKFRKHALKKMAGLYPCSEEEREKLWEIWKYR
jgi:hypothetical protein